jgi:deoxyribonuclease-4
MDELLFGISGLPMGDDTRRLNYATGIHYLRSIGLDAMELLFVRSVNVTEHNKDVILGEERGKLLSFSTCFTLYKS